MNWSTRCACGIRDADALNSSGIHSFRELMSDQADVIADGCVWRRSRTGGAGPPDPASTVLNAATPCRRLSADGRRYLRQAHTGDWATVLATFHEGYYSRRRLALDQAGFNTKLGRSWRSSN